MLKVRDIMTRDVLTLPPDATLRDAIALMSKRHVSGVPVLAGNRLAGVVSMSDILDFQASTRPVPTERTLQGDWSEEHPDWESENETPSVYFTELWDDAGADVQERMATVDTPEWDPLGEHTLAEVMNRRLCSIGPDAEVPKAAAYMRQCGVHRVLVVDKGKLVGIVSALDIARAVADKKLFVRRYVFDRGRRPAGRYGGY